MNTTTTTTNYFETLAARFGWTPAEAEQYMTAQAVEVRSAGSARGLFHSCTGFGVERVAHVMMMSDGPWIKVGDPTWGSSYCVCPGDYLYRTREAAELALARSLNGLERMAAGLAYDKAARWLNV